MNEETQEVNVPQEESPMLQLPDIKIMVGIIDTVSKRGAFAGNELLSVGQLREKLVSFITFFEPPVEQEPPAEQVSEPGNN